MEETIRKHNLEQYIEEDGWLHFEIGKGMYGIPEAGRLANDLLRARMKKTWIHRSDTYTRILETHMEAHQLDVDSR